MQTLFCNSCQQWLKHAISHTVICCSSHLLVLVRQEHASISSKSDGGNECSSFVEFTTRFILTIQVDMQELHEAHHLRN